MCVEFFNIFLFQIDRVPMKRLGSVEEVIKSVAFLLSDDSSYTTATNLVVDGGMSGGLKAWFLAVIVSPLLVYGELWPKI